MWWHIWGGIWVDHRRVSKRGGFNHHSHAALDHSLFCEGEQWEPGVQGLKRIRTLIPPATLERHRPAQRYQDENKSQQLGNIQDLYLLQFQEDTAFFPSCWPITTAKAKKSWCGRSTVSVLLSQGGTNQLGLRHGSSSFAWQEKLTAILSRHIHDGDVFLFENFLWMCFKKFRGFSTWRCETLCMKSALCWPSDSVTVLTVQLFSVGRLVRGARRGISGEQWLRTAR